jgi:hypothetical protein
MRSFGVVLPTAPYYFARHPIVLFVGKPLKDGVFVKHADDH